MTNDPEYMKAFKEYCTQNAVPHKSAAEKGKAHAAFAKTATYKERGFVPRPKKVQVVAKAPVSCQDRGNEQYLVRLHSCAQMQLF